ncbi:hypothetical protein GP486_001365 [Trichoglossum hirsutum]|uniref:Uncharacterized protein n=1 Tax=Trichoglossum hirsutum TaxID=265104 RepID=A0A9P8LGT0_9PEZI|nr:hypothetical protein GP486_001365 [Trichoglossum hirsutum]
MTQVLEGIGFGILALSLYPLGKAFFPEQFHATTTVRIGVGTTWSNETTASTGGNTPGIGVFDTNGQRIGFMSGTKKGKINDGMWHDIMIPHIDAGNTREPEYLSVSGGGTDSLCISYISVTTAGGENSIFYGDVPKQCGAAWYHSNTHVILQGSYPYYPSCFWITAPDSDGKKSKDFPGGMAYHIIDFLSGNQARSQQYIDHPETMCQSTPRFKMYPTLTEMNCIPVFDPPIQPGSDFGDSDFSKLKTGGKVTCDPGPNSPVTLDQTMKLQKWYSNKFQDIPTYGVKKRSVVDSSNQACIDHHVVISDVNAHTATALCKSDTSVGPDFVSTKEGLYCDMCAHELWHVCDATITQGCFDRNTTEMRPGTGPQARDGLSGRQVPAKKYTRVTEWKRTGVDG